MKGTSTIKSPFSFRELLILRVSAFAGRSVLSPSRAETVSERLSAEIETFMESAGFRMLCKYVSFIPFEDKKKQ
ncbi:hypothetical protein BpHYR1_037730 [Brachionus plicatilis]|uniref:Uncharacterized protein n=1 Tax=Brachionus plicatilis TaxID=10195 RepID=A0A3M7SBG5_BRAPC|nr:hypothetical protein BpHYR1_037730 [Brachionus plicatilis]